MNNTQSNSEENVRHFCKVLGGPGETPFSEAVINYVLKESGLTLVKVDENSSTTIEK
jgi:hypothetical protein